MKYFLQQLGYKLMGIVQRLFFYIKTIPNRVFRLFQHLWLGLSSLHFDRDIWWKGWLRKEENNKRITWWFSLLFLILDLAGIGEWYETLAELLKFRSRPLDAYEKSMAASVFGESLNLNSIRIDERSYLGPKQRKFAYVSFQTINSWGNLSNSILIHELVHIWQYRRFGSAYIPRALYAQSTAMGYNYGGVDALYKAHAQQQKLWHFNFEQMADIVSDYYRIREGYLPRWGKGTKQDLAVYEYFAQQIRTI